MRRHSLRAVMIIHAATDLFPTMPVSQGRRAFREAIGVMAVPPPKP